MSANDSLPVILVSAVDAAAASVLISEIIDDGGPVERCSGGGAVWRLRNKYYSAAARLLPLPDGAEPPPGLDVQAHVIYLTEDECADAAAGAAACARRAERARAHVSEDAVRLLAGRAAREGAWAAARRYEPVALLAPAGKEGEEDGEARGAARLREALHAHAWPGLRRAGAPAAPAAPSARPEPGDDGSVGSAESSDGEWGEWVSAGEGEEEAEAEARAGQFAAALALLPARAAGRDAAARRLHAEQLVVAFCRALGHRLPGPREGDGGTQ